MATYLARRPDHKRASWVIMLLTYDRVTRPKPWWKIGWISVKWDWNPRLYGITGPLPRGRAFHITFENAPWVHDDTLDRPISCAPADLPRAA